MRTSRVLHVGADCQGHELPPHYRGWERVCFDINPREDADYVGDVRNMAAIDDLTYDAVFLNRVLELFHPWEVPQIVREAARVTKFGGFVEARVPDADAIFRAVIDGHPVDAPLAHSDDGPLTPQNLIYGRIGRTRNAASFMAHRVLFTSEVLRRELRAAGLRVELDGACTDAAYHCFAIGRKTEGDNKDSIEQLLESVTELV